MAAVLSESAPDTAKAATTAADPDLLHFSFPIEKKKDTGTVNPVDGTPDIEIWGKASDGTLDSDLQIVDPDWSMSAIKTWFDTKANIRMGHDPKRPVGKGIDVDGHEVRAVIAEPVAKHLVRQGVLNDFSVGIMHPDIRVGDPRFKHLDPQHKAVNGVITGRPDGLSAIGEISIVDRGSNFGTKFQLCKAAADGSAEWSGELTAPEEVLTKISAPKAVKTVTVELPKNMSLSVKPSDLARLATLRQQLAAKTAVPEVTKAAEPAPEALVVNGGDEVLKAVKAAESAVYKRDIDTATRRRLAGEGRALPNLSYPVENHEDAGNAVTLILSGHGDVGAARSMVKRIARKEGWKDILGRLKGGKKDKAAKTAEPQVTKCDACDSTGKMPDGKPCMSCKPGKKMAAKAARAEKRKVRKALSGSTATGASTAVVKKKTRVMCPNCGAKQNVKHAHCPECGRPLPRSAPPVMKNHDFACLHCGKDELDKGEKFCPGCGNSNPGYLPEADHKIPANKAAKERVKTKKAKGKKGDAFGGKKASPFGAKDDAGDDGDAKDAKKAAGVVKRKGKGKGRKPTDGVAGQHDTMSLPPHREPDGAPVEEFEDDASLQDGDDRQEMAAAMRHKALGIDSSLGVLHDLTCPAFDVADVAKAFPYATFGAVNAEQWQAKALDAAASAPIAEAGAAMALWQHATTLKTADPELMHDLRIEAHKAFRDANPGPGTFPTPGHVTPQMFRRPYIDDGHGAASPLAAAPHSFDVPEGQLSAADYHRPYLGDGHAADSPGNDTPRHEPQPASMEAGKPDRVYYRGTMRDNARQAMTAMHSHIAHIFPDVCPMSPELGGTQKPAPQVPVGVGGPAPHASKKAVKAAKRKAARVLAAKRRRLERKVLAGKMTVKAARKSLGLKPAAAKAARVKVTKAAPLPVATPLDADAIKAAMKEATAPLLERQARQEKVIRKQRKAIDAIAGQADTRTAPNRGVALNKTSVVAAPPLTAAGLAEQAQVAQLRMLYKESRENPDPEQREAARSAYFTQLGLHTMTPPT